MIVGHLSEPLLEFGHSQNVEHPQDGLYLFGPLDTPDRPSVVHVGVIGTKDGIALMRGWLKSINSPIAVADPTALHTTNWPGFAAAFGAKLPNDPIVEIAIDRLAIDNAARKTNRTDAVRSMVNLYEDAILEHLRREESRPSVWLVIVPEIVFTYGRPQVAGPKDGLASTIIPKKSAKKFLKNPSMFNEMNDEAEIYLFANNFHHQLKAQLLESQTVIQIVRETTLDPMLVVDKFGKPRRQMQERAKIAWNFATTLFFKAGGQPWQIANVRPGVCYVGLVFKQDQSPATRGEACCAAQMFLNSGNGVVFRGALGPWYSDDKREFHLSRKAAKDLIADVIAGYRSRHGGDAPKELFIHGRQGFDDEEWRGFEEAAPAGTNVVGVRIKRTQDLRLFRPSSKLPVLRGTYVTVSPREGYLWSTGFTPRLATYPGFETPKPLAISITHGRADITTVMTDVLGLTKVNYNSCEFASGNPVTLKFADAIGDILVASPKGLKAPPLPFRFYI
jgi:hypothetical protein